MLNMMENILVILSMFLAFGVIFVSNPISSLLCLILLFALSSMLFLILGVEFMSIIMFLMYMGAIAVLFLFVMMMLNLKLVELTSYYLRYLPMGSFIMFFFFLELCFFIYLEFSYMYSDFVFIEWIDFISLEDDMFFMSTLMYTHYGMYFFCLALMLLMSMIGSIILVMNWGNSKNSNLYHNVYFYKNKHHIKFVN